MSLDLMEGYPEPIQFFVEFNPFVGFNLLNSIHIFTNCILKSLAFLTVDSHILFYGSVPYQISRELIVWTSRK